MRKAKVAEGDKKNKKAVLVFLLGVMLCGVAGGVLSVGIHMFEDNIHSILNTIKGWFSAYGITLAMAIMGINIFLSLFFRVKAKKLCRTWDGEDDTLYETIESKMGWYVGITSVGLIVSLVVYFSMASVILNIPGDKISMPVFIGSLILFCVSTFTAVFTQRKMVEYEKQLNPNMKGEALDLNFQKDWLASCDEQERLRIYQASYKVYISSSAVFAISFAIMVFASTFFTVGIFSFFLLGAIWIIQTVIYVRESDRLLKGKSNLPV